MRATQSLESQADSQADEVRSRMLTNIFFTVLQHVSNQIPFITHIFSRLLVTAIAFTIPIFAQNSFSVNDGVDKLVRPRIVQVAATSAAPLNTVELEQKAFQLLNQKRVEVGLSPLIWNESMAKVARLHSTNMANFKFFSHKGLDGLQVDGRAESLGFNKWKGIGENIAYNRGFANPVEFTVERWMLSDSHRENLLDKRWKESAVGIAVTKDGTYYFTEVFWYK
jgi:uncharacterized protein YkwD